MENIDTNNKKIVEEQLIRLCNDAMHAEHETNYSIQQFNKLINDDFIKFSRKESGCDNLKAYIQLENIRARMQEIALFPEVNRKTVIAIGGGFSAGKSSFINSLLENRDRTLNLATGNKPVTAVPSYVVNTTQTEKIRGVNFKDAAFDISDEAYKCLNYEFTNGQTLEVNSLIKYCTLQLRFIPGLFDNCCLVDLPGYNSSSSIGDKANDLLLMESDDEMDFDIDVSDDLSDIRIRNTDYQRARQSIKSADALIWMFSLEKGPIQSDDLDFLINLGFGSENAIPLYIVGNKADLRLEKENDASLKFTETALKERGIKPKGLCCYSSKASKDYVSGKSKDIFRVINECPDIFEFIHSMNYSKNIKEELQRKLDAVFSIYFSNINDEINFSDEILSRLNGIKRRCYMDGVFEYGKETQSALYTELKNLQKILQKKVKPSKNLDIAKEEKNKLSNCINVFCDSLSEGLEPSIKNQKKIFCTFCGTELNPNSEICPKCYTSVDGENRICPKCGRSNYISTRHCVQCGFDLNNDL